jgi:DNA-binding NtrC family response regulator
MIKKMAGNDSIQGPKPIARLLIVDDEHDIGAALKGGLQQGGIHVDAFSDPTKALEHFRAHSNDYCLPLVDIRMPAINGFQLAREFHTINPNVKKVLMSAFEMRKSEVAQVLSSVKVDDFIAKPFPVSKAKAIILKHIAATKILDES